MMLTRQALFLAFLTVYLTLSCARPRPTPDGPSLCSYALKNAACTNDALGAIGGHYDLKCDAAALDGACTPDELNTLVARFSCLDDRDFCALAEEFKTTTEATKSIKSVAAYKGASLALRECGEKVIGSACQKGFEEDILNPFDLPNNPSGLPYGLIRGSTQGTTANAGGMRGNAICARLEESDFVNCANRMLEAVDGYYRVTCDGAALDKACTPAEQSELEKLFTCFTQNEFCKNVDEYITLTDTDPKAAATQYAKTVQIFETCKVISVSSVCDQSVKEEQHNPFDLPQSSSK
jgi:hypothetical protein